MARSIPAGWTRGDRYHMTKGALSICRVWVGGDMRWELWRGKECVYRGRDEEGAYDEAVALSIELEEVAL